MSKGPSFDWCALFSPSPLSLLDRKETEERRSGSSRKDKRSDGSDADTAATKEVEPMETEASAASSPVLNGQQELLHSEGDTQSN